MTLRVASLGAWTRSIGIALGSTVCLAVPAFAQLVRQPAPPAGPKLLVVTFGRVVPADSDIAIEVGDAFRERFHLAHTDDFTTIQKRVMCDALDQSGFNCTTELEPTQVGQLANVMNARYIADGRIFPRGRDSLLILVRLVQAIRTNPMGTAAALVLPRSKVSGSAGTALADRIDDKFRSFEYIQRCRDEREQKNYEKAVDAARRAMRYDPQSGGALLCLALTLQDQGSPRDTVQKVLEAAHDADSLNTTVARQLAFMYQEQHDTTQLLHMLHHILEVDINDNELRKSAAQLYVLRGHADSAVMLLDVALQRNPNQWDMLNLKAIALGVEDKWDSAVAVMNFAAEADSSKVDSTFISRTQEFATRLGDTAQILRWVQRGTQKVPTWASNWYLYATLLLGKNDTTGAMAAVKQFMTLQPNDGRGHLVYATLLQATGQEDSALVHGRMAAEVDSTYRPAAAGIFLRAAVKALQASVWPRADTLFGQARQWATGDAQNTATFYLGVAQFQEGYQQLQVADTAYRKLQAKDQTARDPGCAALRASAEFFNQAEANMSSQAAVNRETANQLLTYIPQFRASLTQLGSARALKCPS
jgi:tetratricopeptide (TPR) repeat protein